MDKKELLDNFIFCVKEEPVLYVGNIKIEREIYPIYKKYVEEGLGDYTTPEDFFEAHYKGNQIIEVRNLVAENTTSFQDEEFQDKVSGQIILLIIASLMIYFTFFPPLGEILLVISIFEIIILTTFYLLHLKVKKDFSEQFEGTLIIFIYFFVVFIFMIYYDFFPILGEFYLLIWASVVIIVIFLYLLSLIFFRTKFIVTSILTFFYLTSHIFRPAFKITLILILIAIGYLFNYLEMNFG